jgi:hypothetical protein
MLNSFDPQQDSNPGGLTEGLLLEKRLLKKVQSGGVNDRIFQAVQDAFEEALKKEHMVVMPEIAKKFLLAHVMKQVLKDMIRKLDRKHPI